MAEENLVLSEIVVGDDVLLTEKKMSGQSLESLARVVEIRTILGKQTYVIETEYGKRKVVGESQIEKIA